MVGRGGSKQQLTAARHIMAPGMQPRCRAVPRAPLSQSLYYALQPLPTRWTFFPSPSLARALSLSLFFFFFLSFFAMFYFFSTALDQRRGNLRPCLCGALSRPQQRPGASAMGHVISGCSRRRSETTPEAERGHNTHAFWPLGYQHDRALVKGKRTQCKPIERKQNASRWAGRASRCGVKKHTSTGV